MTYLLSFRLHLSHQLDLGGEELLGRSNERHFQYCFLIFGFDSTIFPSPSALTK